MKLFRYWQKDKRKDEIYGLLVVAISLLIILSLIPAPHNKNFIGAFGRIVAKFLRDVFGIIGAYFIPLIMIIAGYQRMEREEAEKFYLQVIGIVLFVVSSCTLLSLLNQDVYAAEGMWGGYLGTFLSQFLRRAFGSVGAGIILVTTTIISFILTTEYSLVEIFNTLKSKIEDIKEIKLPERKFSNGKEAKKVVPKVRELPNIKVTEKPVKPLIHFSPSKSTEKPNRVMEPESQVNDSAQPRLKKVKSLSDFNLPAISMLNEIEQEKEKFAEKELESNAAVLQQTLANFGIEAQVVEVHPGPVITRYDLQPSSGVKVNRIVALENDIALSMRASTVRILAPIPGKGAVGIEVPNSKSQVVSLREILQGKEFQEEESKIVLALGKTVSGQTMVADLQEMPHLLIAGATGSGKSVCINTLIASILYKATPEEVKFLMIDPKMIELPVYNGIPHLLAPVITNAKQAAGALRGMVAEMERRYKTLATTRSRNIDSYNKVSNVEKMPYIVVVIDELADLMILSSVEVEDAIMRLAQMARAVGIHLILATQRPSVDVITGVIKANFPARIAFQVLSKTDSRIILDSGGAEDLVGRGDMLFLPPGAPKPTRLQGALVTDEEINRVVDFWSKQAKPEYKEEILLSSQNTEIDSQKQEKDERFMEAVKLIINTGQASISLLQRRLGIGYNHAGRIIDQMEQDGLIGPADGTKSREVLIDDSYLKEMENQAHVEQM